LALGPASIQFHNYMGHLILDLSTFLAGAGQDSFDIHTLELADSGGSLAILVVADMFHPGDR
jgi:hypothetical protein